MDNQETKLATAEEMVKEYSARASNLRQDLSMSIEAFRKAGDKNVNLVVRELKLAHTKAQEAELWLKEALNVVTSQVPVVEPAAPVTPAEPATSAPEPTAQPEVAPVAA
jgi:hypothetical protein